MLYLPSNDVGESAEERHEEKAQKAAYTVQPTRPNCCFGVIICDK
jgi:hypothetical protein